MSKINDCHVLIPCAGVGSRAGKTHPKQYTNLNGKYMVSHTISSFVKVFNPSDILLVTAPDDNLLIPFSKEIGFNLQNCGGETRAHSVFNGLKWLLDNNANEQDWVLVHDAARCLITADNILKLVNECQTSGQGGILAMPIADTVKKSAASNNIVSTLSRDGLWLAQTPQMFRLKELYYAYLSHFENNFLGITDEASAMEYFDTPIKLVEGSFQNFKVTYPQDFELAEFILKSRV